MDNKADSEKAATPSSIISISPPKIDQDALKLAEMGYKQDLTRRLSVWAVLGVGFALTNSWLAISLALVTGINSGGPALLVYGIIAMFFIALCVGTSLSELASAFPNAGGQYFWTNELAPARWANFASYLTGWFAWAGAIFTSAAVALPMGAACVGCWQLTHPDFVIQPWHMVLAYQLINIMAFFFNCDSRMLPKVAPVLFYTSVISFVIVTIVVPAKAPTHQSAKFVFATFINSTGWQQNGVAFIVGLINCNWAFACLDCATHLAEEVRHPEKMIPIAIFGTIGIGFVTAWLFSVGMMFSLSDLASVTSTETLVPILELFYQAVGNKAGAIVLQAFTIATGTAALIACHTWQTRLSWSFARDRGVPGHQLLSQVHPRLGVPINAHLASAGLVALIGLLPLGSSAAFNSMVTASIVLSYISYSIPVAALLWRGRSNLKHGPFWAGTLGKLANIILLVWTLFTLVMYSFPYAKPVRASNMNYVSALYAILTLIIAVDWFVRARHEFRGRVDRLQGVGVVQELIEGKGEVGELGKG